MVGFSELVEGTAVRGFGSHRRLSLVVQCLCLHGWWVWGWVWAYPLRWCPLGGGVAKGLPGDARSLVDVTPCITSGCCCVPRPFVTVPVPPLPCLMQSSESVAVRVGINGFGRIGRLVTRAAIAHPNTRVVAINVGAPVVFTRHPTATCARTSPPAPSPPCFIQSLPSPLPCSSSHV